MNDMQLVNHDAPIAPWDPDNCDRRMWMNAMDPTRRYPIDFLAGKEVILGTVTKDLITFLRLCSLYQEADIRPIAVFDITLDYRPNVKAVLDKALKDLKFDIPVFSHLIPFKAFCDNYLEHNGGSEHAPIIIKFDHSANDERHYKNVNEHYNSTTFNEEAFEHKVKTDYDIGCRAKKKASNEWIYMMEFTNKLILNTWFVQNCHLYIADCYGDATILLADEAEAKSPEVVEREKAWLMTRVVTFKFYTLSSIEFDPTVNLYELQNRVRNQKVRFVFSSDFGGGKATYCLQNDYRRFLSKDLFTAWFNPDLYYGPGGISTYQKTEVGYIFDALCRYELAGNTKPVYIKMEGRLDRYFFLFLTNGGGGMNNWQYFHLYFKDYEFHMIVKDNENMEIFARDLAIFMRIHLVDPSKVRVFQSVNHCEYFTELSTEKILRTYSTYYTNN